MVSIASSQEMDSVLKASRMAYEARKKFPNNEISQVGRLVEQALDSKDHILTQALTCQIFSRFSTQETSACEEKYPLLCLN